MRLGILGGGQLGKMTALAAAQLGIEVTIWSEHPASPAGRVSAHEVTGELGDPMTQDRLAELADVLTLENEFIDARILQAIAERGLPVFPLPETVATIQDKWRQKEFLRSRALPVPRSWAVHTLEDLTRLGRQVGFPLVLKTRRLGYDGNGTAVVGSPNEAEQAWSLLGGDRSPDTLLVEEFIPFVKELAVMVVRDRRGQPLSYPVVETIQPHQICHTVLAPAPISPDVGESARRIAVRAVEALDGIGAFGVELFWAEPDHIWINEIAPRPHNSGHYSIEACVTSQFENHVRAVVGFSLGPSDLVTPAAVMINLLGTQQKPLTPEILQNATAVPGAHLHLYGKREDRPRRKVGHITALAPTLAQARALAEQAQALIDV